jgi:hypothetical protein
MGGEAPLNLACTIDVQSDDESSDEEMIRARGAARRMRRQVQHNLVSRRRRKPIYHWETEPSRTARALPRFEALTTNFGTFALGENTGSIMLCRRTRVHLEANGHVSICPHSPVPREREDEQDEDSRTYSLFQCARGSSVPAAEQQGYYTRQAGAEGEAAAAETANTILDFQIILTGQSVRHPRLTVFNRSTTLEQPAR